MADRLPQQYSNLPNNFSAGLASQQGLPPHLQVDQQMNASNMSNSPQDNVWSQLQQPPQFRPQPAGSLNGPQTAVNQQMMDFVRSQNLARMQNQQQQHGQLPFGMNSQINSSPVFHDHQGMQNTQPQFSNNNPGVSPYPNALQLQQALATRNPGVLQALSQSRQLELMNLAHNQQPQNGQTAVAALRSFQQQQQQQQQQQHLQQQQQSQQQPSQQQQPQPHQQQSPQTISQMQNQTNQSGFFPGAVLQHSPDLSRNPPAQPNLQQAAAAMAARNIMSTPGSHGRLTYNELRPRAQTLQASIREQEQQLNQMVAARGNNLSDVGLMLDITKVSEELERKKVVLSKILQTMTQMAQANYKMGQPNANGGGPPGAGPSSNQTQQHPPSAVQTNQNQLNWNPQLNPTPTPSFDYPQSTQPTAPVIHNAPSPTQKNTPQMAPQVAAGTMSQPSQPPMSNSLQVLPGGQNANHSSPSMMPSQFSNQMTGNASNLAMSQMHRAQFLPMSREMFITAYRNWSSRYNVVVDGSTLTYEGRQIDLHSLHVEVMLGGGHMRINQMESWPVIAAKLGFVQFPRVDTEPERSGPGAAHHVQQVYNRYLVMFDGSYIKSLISKRHAEIELQRAQLASQAQQNGAPNPTLPNMAAPNGIHNGVPGMDGTGSSQPPSTPAKPGQEMRNLVTLTGISDPQQINELIQYSTVSVEELQHRKVPANIISFVENNRGLLQRSQQSQREFHGGLVKNVQSASVSAFGPVTAQRPGPQTTGGPQSQPNFNTAAGLAMRPGQMPANQSGGMAVPRPPMLPTSNADSQMSIAIRGVQRRPTREELQVSMEFVNRLRQELQTRKLPQMPALSLTEEQARQFPAAFNRLWQAIAESDKKIHVYGCVLGQDIARKLLAFVATAYHQKALLAGNPPKFILDFNTMGMMINQFQVTNQTVTHHIMREPQPHPSQPGFATPQRPDGSPRPPPPQATAQHLRQQPPQLPTLVPPQPPQHPMQHPFQQPPQHSPRLKPPQRHPTPQALPRTPTPVTPNHTNASVPAKRKQPATDPVASTSTPPASASTPIANPPTPAHMTSSPQTPKSPKGKPKPKPPRKPSKTVSKTPASAAPAEPPSTSAAPSAAQPGIKRPHEVTSSGDADPSPKRAKTDWNGPPREESAKTEWEGVPSEALVKKQEEIEGIRTEEDTAKFFEQMTDWLKVVSTDEDHALEISNSLEQILKGCGASTDLSDTSGLQSFGSSMEHILGGPSSPSASFAIDEAEFFDFTSFGGAIDEDSSSKAPTPDLIPASSANPSPGSGSETEGHVSGAVDTAKIADSSDDAANAPDLLRLGSWREIDGGQSSYYQASDAWKWDEPMATSEQPWAISNS